MESATRYWRACLQGKNGDTGRENRLVDAVDEGGGGANEERRTGTSARPRKAGSWWDAAVQHRELSSEPCDDRRGGMEAWRGAQEAGNVCTHIAGLRCCTAETNTRL